MIVWNPACGASAVQTAAERAHQFVPRKYPILFYAGVATDI